MSLATDYATALFESNRASEKKDERALMQNFMQGLKRRGHLKLLPKIAAEYEKLEQHAMRSRPKIAMARESDKAAAVAKAREFLPDGTAVEVCVDPTLVSGFVVSGPDFRYDASGRRSLLDLYHKLVSSR